MSLNPPIREWRGKRVWLVGASTGTVVCGLLREAPRHPPGTQFVAISPDGARAVVAIYGNRTSVGSSLAVFDLTRRDTRAYVAHLSPDGREPAGWPAFVSTGRGMVRHAPWSAYRARWLSLYEAAGRIVRGEIARSLAAYCGHGVYMPARISFL